MEKITQSEFDLVYENHQLWIESRADEDLCMKLEDVDFCEIKFVKKVNLEGANLRGANLRGAILEGANLRGAILERANFEGANLKRANLKRANLERANLRGVILEGTNLEGAILERAYLKGAYLFEANLEGAIFKGAYLKGANLEGAYLEGAYLEGANLRGANLRWTNLEGANLEGAILFGANLFETNLKGANLKGANLKGAILFGAILDNTVLAEEQIEKNNTEREIIDKYKATIIQLEKEKVDLLANKNSTEDDIHDKQSLIEKMQEQLKKQEKEKEQEQKQAKDQELKSLKNAFDELGKADKDLKKEINKLNKMFTGYYAFAFVSFLLLLAVWIRYMIILNNDMTFQNAALNVLPSLLLITIIILLIYQAHKCQRQSVALRRLLYKPLQIEGVLQAYIHISGGDNMNDTKNKLNEVLNNFVCQVINEKINIDEEEKRLKENDKKEGTVNEKILDIALQIIKQFGGKPN